MPQQSFTQKSKISGNSKDVGIFQRRFYLLSDIWNFLKVRKRWWLLPLIIMMLLLGLLIVFSQSSAISPFIYALF